MFNNIIIVNEYLYCQLKEIRYKSFWCCINIIKLKNMQRWDLQWLLSQYPNENVTVICCLLDDYLFYTHSLFPVSARYQNWFSNSLFLPLSHRLSHVLYFVWYYRVNYSILTTTNKRIQKSKNGVNRWNMRIWH